MLSSQLRIKENAGLVLVWSVFALVEGTLRMVNNTKPTNDIDYWASENNSIPIGVFLLAGVAEVFFGIAGVFLGVFALFLNKHSTNMTNLLLGVQVILGCFVFITFVIADPIINAKNATGTDLLSQNEQRGLILLGNMLGSITFCCALRGGQFIFILRLLQSQKGESECKYKNRVRGLVWSANMIAAAVSTLYVGGLSSTKGLSNTTFPIGASPHVVWRPQLSFVTGIIMLAYGGLGTLAMHNKSYAEKMPILFVITTLAMMINFSWTFGIVLAPPIPGAAQHVGLVLAMTILPLFHSQRAHESVEEYDNVTTESLNGKQLPQ